MGIAHPYISVTTHRAVPQRDSKEVTMERLVCTPEEAASMLVTSPDEIRRLIKVGEIPAYRNGTHYKIVISQLKEYIESRATKETKERRNHEQA